MKSFTITVIFNTLQLLKMTLGFGFFGIFQHREPFCHSKNKYFQLKWLCHVLHFKDGHTTTIFSSSEKRIMGFTNLTFTLAYTALRISILMLDHIALNWISNEQQ